MYKLFKRAIAVASIIAILAPTGLVLADGTPKPDDPTNLNQSNDGSSTLAVGGVNTNGELFLSAQVSENLAADKTDKLTLEAEVKKVDTAFDSPANSSYESTVTVTGSTPVTATVKISGLAQANYHWQVRVRNQANPNIVSNWVSFGSNADSPLPAATDFKVDFPPGVPTKINAVACQDGCPTTHSVGLTWVNPSDKDLQSIEIFRSTNSQISGDKIANLDKSLEYYVDNVDNTAVEGTIYYYRVRAVDVSGTPGAFSEVVSTVTNIEIKDSDGLPHVVKSCPGETTWAPGGIEGNVSVAASGSGCDITYWPNIKTEAVYEIFVNWVTKPTPFEEGTQAKDATYSVTANKVTREFSVDQTKRGDGSLISDPSLKNVPSGFHKLGEFAMPAGISSSVRLVASKTGYVVADQDRFVYLRPVPPANLTAADQPNDNGNEIGLSWVASNSGTTTAYNVYRSITPGNYPGTPLAKVTSTKFADASVANGVTYFYVVRATDRDRESSNSNEASAMAKDNLAPARPTINSIETGDGFIAMTWTKPTDAAGYIIRYRDPAKETTYHSVTIADGTVSQTKITDLTNGVTYEIGIATFDSSGNQSDFNTVKATPTAPPAPVKTEKQNVVQAATTQTPPAPAPVNTDEGKIKAADTSNDKRQQAAATVAILVVAVAAGVAGYYGYDWWLKQAEEKKDNTKNGRW